MSRPDRQFAPPGFSLVELLAALAVLTIGLVSIFLALSSSRGQLMRLDVQVIGRLLAQSILEQAVHRFEIRDARYFDVNTPPGVIVTRAGNGGWKPPFEALASPRTRVLPSAGAGNPYFSADGPVWPTPMDESERRFYERFSYEVRVSYETTPVAGGAAVPLDADADGRGETDLARIEVEVFAMPLEGPQQEQSVCNLTTLVAAGDSTPGAASLGGF